MKNSKKVKVAKHSEQGKRVENEIKGQLETKSEKGLFYSIKILLHIIVIYSQTPQNYSGYN